MGKEFIFPDLGEGITEGELVRWLVKEGDFVKEDQEVAEIETDKALVTIPSPFTGVVEKLCCEEGEMIQVGSVLMIFREGEESQKPAKEEAVPSKVEESETVPLTSSQKTKLPPMATPFTRKIARELGINLNQVKGTGPGGRITEEDVKNFSESKITEPSPTPLPVTKPHPSTPKPIAGINFEKYGPVERIPLKGVRRKISKNMLIATQQAVMVTHIDEGEVGKLIKIRNEKKKFAEEKGVKLTILPFLMKACVIALKENPSLNASLVGEEIIFKKYYNFGFAVDTEAGLMVPVVKEVDKKSIMHLAAEMSELSQKARDRTIALEDLQGNSFTITNIGSIGGRYVTPIINYPDSAILAAGKIYEKPIVKEKKVVPGNVLPLCITFDHRVSDGATAARFVNEVIQYLNDPDLLLLEDGEE